MNQDELNRFLASVRKTRFTDYLDPIGETALQAFERRIRWAQRSLDDPANVDEANFLLDYEYELRELVKNEMEQEADEDWVIGVDAGEEAGPRAWGNKAAAARESLDDGFAPDEPPPARRLNTGAGVPVRRTDTAPEDPIEPAALRRAPTPTDDAADVPFKRGAPARPAAKPAAKSATSTKTAPGGPAVAGRSAATKPAAPGAKAAPVVGKGRGKAGMLPEEPDADEDPWDVEQTGIMRMEDLTPTPLHARANAPKPPAPKPAAPAPRMTAPDLPAERSAPKSIMTGSGPETVDAASGWDDAESADDFESPVDMPSGARSLGGRNEGARSVAGRNEGALRGRGTPAPIQRSPTPTPAFEPESEPSRPEPVNDPVSAGRSTAPALLSRSALVQNTPQQEAPERRRSRMPLVLGFLVIGVAAAAGAVVFVPGLGARLGLPADLLGSGSQAESDVAEPAHEPVEEVVAQADPPEAPPDPGFEVLDLTADAPPEVLDLTQDAPAAGSVTAADPKSGTGGTKIDTKAASGQAKAPDTKAAETKTADTKTATKTETKATSGTDTKTASGTDTKTATGTDTKTTAGTDTKTASTSTTSKTDAGTATKTESTTKTDAGTATAATDASATPAAPVSLKGLWTGKIDGKALYLTIIRIDGTAVTASAEFQRDDGFKKWDLRGTYDEASGAIDLSDAGGGGTIRGNLKENKFAGGAVIDGAQVTWSAAKR